MCASFLSRAVPCPGAPGSLYPERRTAPPSSDTDRRPTTTWWQPATPEAPVSGGTAERRDTQVPDVAGFRVVRFRLPVACSPLAAAVVSTAGVRPWRTLESVATPEGRLELRQR